MPNKKEIQAMLEFHPHRIGHACCLGEEEWRCLKASKIPVRYTMLGLSSFFFGGDSEIAVDKL